MALQARAEATRRRILDAAVTLFSDNGYGETDLSEVLLLSGVSKGAFYYHFSSKEALASAIIDEYSQRLQQVVAARIDESAPTLTGLIDCTFAVYDVVNSEPASRLGQLLTQALSQVSETGHRFTGYWTTWMTNVVTGAARAGELRSDVDPAEAADALWSGIMGAHLVSAGLGDDVAARLSRLWRVLLPSLVPGDSVAGLETVVAESMQRYRSAS